MSRWYKRRADDVARESSAPRRRSRRRPRRKVGPNARWSPRLDVPRMPPYLPDLGSAVVVRLREGTIDQFEEVHGHVVGMSSHPSVNFATLEVQNCTRKVHLLWHGCEWKCSYDRFYYEVDLQPEPGAAAA